MSTNKSTPNYADTRRPGAGINARSGAGVTAGVTGASWALRVTGAGVTGFDELGASSGSPSI